MNEKLKIKIIMTTHSLSREQVAELLGFSVGYLDQLLYNRDRAPKVGTADRLIEELKKKKAN
jgi:transcriptional regulator with XRE-family HTH domain